MIASTDNPEREGTKGLYLRERDTGVVYLLTCRHVMLGASSAHDDFKDLHPSVAVLQPGNQTLYDIKTQLTLDIGDIIIPKDEENQAIAPEKLSEEEELLRL